MTPNRARGRPRSDEHRDAVLKAAMKLTREDDLRRASIDRIFQRSGVSKATIYKWWPNRTAVAGHWEVCGVDLGSADLWSGLVLNWDMPHVALPQANADLASDFPWLPPLGSGQG